MISIDRNELVYYLFEIAFYTLYKEQGAVNFFFFHYFDFLVLDYLDIFLSPCSKWRQIRLKFYSIFICILRLTII